MQSDTPTGTGELIKRLRDHATDAAMIECNEMRPRLAREAADALEEAVRVIREIADAGVSTRLIPADNDQGYEEREHVSIEAAIALGWLARHATGQKHDLYKTGDPDAPDVIKDRNGEVVLELCRRCRQGESQLGPVCPGQKGGDDDS